FKFLRPCASAPVCYVARRRSLRSARSAKRSIGRLRAIMELERGKPAIAPTHARGDLIGRQYFFPLREDMRELLALVNRGICRAQRAQARTIAPAVIGDAARRVELDGLERPHE